jgi:YD repeat-containing protein
MRNTHGWLCTLAQLKLLFARAICALRFDALRSSPILLAIALLLNSQCLQAQYTNPLMPANADPNDIVADYIGFGIYGYTNVVFGTPQAALETAINNSRFGCAYYTYEDTFQSPPPTYVWYAHYLAHACDGTVSGPWIYGVPSEPIFVCTSGSGGPHAMASADGTDAVFYCQLGPTQPPGFENAGPPPTCPNSPPSTCVANPINTTTGNKFQVETDYVGAGPYPLIFKRTYNSLPAGKTSLGAAWSHTYSRSVLTASASQVMVRRPDGKSRRFVLAGNTWMPVAQGTDRLLAFSSGGTLTGWQYVGTGDEVETYDASGKLVSIANRAGITQTLSYDGSGRLAQVSDSLGRTLTFTYDTQDRVATLTDPAGGIYTYSYDSYGNLVSLTYPDSKVRTYLYENTSFLNALTGIVDENNSRFSTYGYDSQGRAVSSQHAGGAELYMFTYNSNATVVVDPQNTSRTFNWQVGLGLSQLTAVSQPCAHCGDVYAAATYDANGNVASTTDWNGNRTNYTYDLVLNRNLQLQRVEGLTSAGATTAVTRTISTQWHPTFLLPVQVAEPKRITTYTYDAQGNLASKSIQATTDTSGSQGFSATPAGSPRTWTYTNTYSSTTPGLLIQQVVDGPRTDLSDTTTYVYDGTTGNLASITNALGHVTTFGDYDAHGRPQRVTDPNGRDTLVAYDLRGRVVSLNIAAAVTTYAYDGVGQLMRVTLPAGQYVSYTYDSAHRLTQIQDKLGNKIVYMLDGMGNRVKKLVYDRYGTLKVQHQWQYDTLNRLLKDIGGFNQTTQYGYDSNGNRTSVDGPLTTTPNDLTIYSYDALNRLRQVTDALSGVTSVANDGLDQVTQVSDPRSVATAYGVDGLGNVGTQVSPDAGTSIQTYDAAGNVLTSSNPALSYSYDALNRILTVTGSDGLSNAFTYDQGVNGKGRRTQAVSGNAQTTWSYDFDGVVTQRQDAIAGGPTLSVQYVYDGNRHVYRMTYPSGRVLTFIYDNSDRVLSISSPGLSIVSSATHLPFGPALSWTWGGSSSLTRTYDLDGRLWTFPVAASTGNVVYDNASRITGVNLSGSPAINQLYSYDVLDRLKSYSDLTTGRTYSYDAGGNRIDLAIGATHYASPIDPASNRLLSAAGPGGARTFGYDAAGNTISDGQASFTYDSLNRLVSATKGTISASYTYNALHQRVKKTGPASVVPTATNYFAYDEAGKLIGEYDSSGAPIQEYVYLDDIPVGILRGSVSAPQLYAI